MNWRKANRNKQRRLAREHVASAAPRRLFSLGWREWLKKIGPELILQNTIRDDSLFARLMARPDLLARRRFKLPLKGFPYFVPPDHRTSGAYQGPSRYFKIVDDIDFSVSPFEPRTRGATADLDALRRAAQGEVVIDDLSAPSRPLPTKEFIYGDHWVAYRRIGNG